LVLNYGFKVAHDDAPLFEVPVGEQDLSYKVLLSLKLRQRPASIELAILGAQGFHLGFVEGDEAHKEPQKREDDGFGKGLMREDASDKE
jgi:hypothetical protein